MALYPSLLAALVAYGVSLHLGVEPTRFSVAIPAQSTGVFIRVAVLGVLCAVWRALAARRKAYLVREARSLVDVHAQKEADGEQ